MRIVLGLALAIALTAASQQALAATPMSMSAYREAYVAEIHRQRPHARVQVTGRNKLSVTVASGVMHVVLDDAYELYLQQPTHLEDELHGYVLAMLQVGPPRYTAAQLIIFVVPATYAASLHRPLLEHPIAGDLVAIAVVKAVDVKLPPATELSEHLGLKGDEIWARALRNTRRQMSPVRIYNGVFGYSNGKPPWAASAMADPVWWDSPRMQKGGSPIVAPIDKDLLLVAHLNDPGEPRELRLDAGRRVPSDRFSQHVFVRRNGAWEVLPP